MKTKIDLALEFLKEGQAFSVDDLRFELEDKQKLVVIGWSQYLNFSSLNKTSSLKELEEIKYIFSKMLESSGDLRAFIAKKLIKYKLCFDDGGKASIDICAEEGEVITWFIDL